MGKITSMGSVVHITPTFLAQAAPIAEASSGGYLDSFTHSCLRQALGLFLQSAIEKGVPIMFTFSLMSCNKEAFFSSRSIPRQKEACPPYHTRISFFCNCLGKGQGSLPYFICGFFDKTLVPLILKDTLGIS